jgi:hypothetical protein
VATGVALVPASAFEREIHMAYEWLTDDELINRVDIDPDNADAQKELARRMHGLRIITEDDLADANREGYDEAIAEKIKGLIGTANQELLDFEPA